MFFVLFIGNTMTTLMVIPDKLREKVNLRYQFMDNLRWATNNIRGEVNIYISNLKKNVILHKIFLLSE